MKTKTKFLLLTIVLLFAIALLPSNVFAGTYGDLTFQIDDYENIVRITDCNETATNVTIPSEISGYKVTEIGLGAFSNCTNLTSVTIPETIENISYSAFFHCSSLNNVNIPNSVQTINDDAFNGCSSLNNISIPSTIKEIGGGAFANCTSLKSINLPTNIQEIDNGLFTGCSSLSSITVPGNVKKIQQGAFENCINLTDVNLPDGITEFGSYVFKGCSKLKTLKIPAALKRIGWQCFRNCTSLESLELPLEMDYIDDLVFEGCSSLTKIVLPYQIGGISAEGPLGSSGAFHGVNPNMVAYVVKNTYAHKYAANNDLKMEFYTIDIARCSVEQIPEQTYTGGWLTPAITVKCGSTELVNGTDYTVSYSNNKDAGTATVTIKGIGNFYGQITRNFNIKNPIKKLSQCKVNNISDQNYTGKSLKPDVTIKDGNKKLKNGVDYTISYKNNKNPGKATMTIKGKGNYTGTVTKTFTIKVRKVSGLKAKSQSTTSIKLSWSKATGVSKYQLYKYNSSKKKWEKITTTSSTSYTVKKLKAGTTYKFRIRAYKTISKKTYYGSYSSTLETATKTSTPKISKITSKSKKATLNWKKVSGASGYEVYMATSKKGKYIKVKSVNSKIVKYTKSSLKKKKTYYFKIRTYKKVDGKKIYSSYSSVKSIKIK